MRRALVLVSASACATPVTAPSLVNASAVGAPSPASAEASLATDTPLDFERPFVAKPRGRAATRDQFLQLCRGGDHRSCWIAAQIAEGPVSERYRTVATLCREGDTMSCRALPEGEFLDEPGASSRDPACREGGASRCDQAALRRECAIGFPAACAQLAATTGVTDIDALVARLETLARAGCAAGIASECLHYLVRESSLEANQRFCNLTDNCGPLGVYYETVHDLGRARDSLERSCEYNKDLFRACIALAESYFSGAYAEPVAGRAQALVDYACPLVPAPREKVLANYPACRHARTLQR